MLGMATAAAGAAGTAAVGVLGGSSGAVPRRRGFGVGRLRFAGGRHLAPGGSVDRCGVGLAERPGSRRGLCSAAWAWPCTWLDGRAAQATPVMVAMASTSGDQGDDQRFPAGRPRVGGLRS